MLCRAQKLDIQVLGPSRGQSMSCATYYQSASCRKADCVTQSGRRRRPLLRCRSVQASQKSSAEGMAAASHNLGHSGCRMVAVSMTMKPPSWKITSQPEAPREVHLCCMTDRRFYTWIQRRLLITTWYLSGLENTSASAQLHRYQKRSGAGHQFAIADASHGEVFQVLWLRDHRKAVNYRVGKRM